MLSNNVKQYATEKLAARLASLPRGAADKIRSSTLGLSGDIKTCLEFLCATLPPDDILSIPFGILKSEAEHSLLVYKRDIWAQRMSEDIFLNFVLCPRVNSEAIEPCRRLFYDELICRVQDMTLENAVLEANIWCCEHAAYHASDDRTQGALTTYLSGSGRCGEESVFVVNALRSLGIAARQVYAPFWSHCDDNHAWVEVFISDKWRFLGACEPEPCLDMGWFTKAASRAMLVHTRAFSNYVGSVMEREELIEQRGDAFLYNETRRYADTRRLTFTVSDSLGRAVRGAEIRLQVLNMAAYRDIAVLTTDKCGNASFTCGYGSLHAEASLGRLRCAADISPRCDAHIQLTLGDGSAHFYGTKKFIAPDVRPPVRCTPNAAAVAFCRERLKSASALCASRVNSFFSDFKKTHSVIDGTERFIANAYGNADEINDFLTMQSNELLPWAIRLLSTLSDKDMRDAKSHVLNDHFVRAMSFYMRSKISDDVFINYILSPRIGTEQLRPWRGALFGALSENERKEFSESPELIYSFISDNADSERLFDISASVGSQSCDMIFVALARSLGIASRLSTVTHDAEYYDNGVWKAARCAAIPSHVVFECSHENAPVFIYGTNIGISMMRENAFVPLELSGRRFFQRDRLCLPAGAYRIVCVNRLPNGCQLANVTEFELSEGEQRLVHIELPQAEAEDMLQSLPLDDFVIFSDDGKPINASSLVHDGSNTLFAFLQTGAEPTEHFLSEIIERSVDASSCFDIVFVLSEHSQISYPPLQTFLRRCPNARVFFDENNAQNVLARCMFSEPGVFPVTALVSGDFRGIYGYCGYTVGGVDMAIKLSKYASRNSHNG